VQSSWRTTGTSRALAPHASSTDRRAFVVVTAAEDRVADAVIAAEVGPLRRLPLLLTTVDILTTAEHGPFDCVWRIPGGQNGRRAWPEPSRIPLRTTSP